MHQKRKILITDHVHPILLNGLEELNFGCDYLPKIQTNQVKPIIDQYSGLIINSKILVDQSMIDRADKLRFIGRLGSGMEIVDVDYAVSKDIAVLRTPEGNCDAVAEHVIGMILSFANNLFRTNQEVRELIWKREANRGFELMNKKLGIIGFGYTGKALARKLAGFDCQVLAYDKYLKSYAADFPNVEEVDMERIFREADILSVHLPLTEETKHLVNLKFLEQFERKILLINTSRGPIVRTEDLITALEAERFGVLVLTFLKMKNHKHFQQQKKACTNNYLRSKM